MMIENKLVLVDTYTRPRPWVQIQPFSWQLYIKLGLDNYRIDLDPEDYKKRMTSLKIRASRAHYLFIDENLLVVTKD